LLLDVLIVRIFTDSGPEKGVRNEPSNISISCEYIAKVKKMEPTEVRQITTANAINLFPKLARFVAR
jgi:TatD DNase family protein